MSLSSIKHLIGLILFTIIIFIPDPYRSHGTNIVWKKFVNPQYDFERYDAISIVSEGRRYISSMYFMAYE